MLCAGTEPSRIPRTSVGLGPPLLPSLPEPHILRAQTLVKEPIPPFISVRAVVGV